MARRRRPGLLVAQLGLGLALVVGIFWSFQSNVFKQSSSPLPEKIAYLSLVSSTSGEAALNQISGLHGLDVGLSDGYVGEYRGREDRMTVWVGITSSPERAAELVRRMTEGIQDSNPMFSHVGLSNVHGVGVHVIQGPEGISYYFPLNNEVIWLTVVSAQPQGLLEQTLEIWH